MRWVEEYLPFLLVGFLIGITPALYVFVMRLLLS